MQHWPYELRMPPLWRGATLFASPHSGRDYPDVFKGKSDLSAHDLRSSEDAYVDELYRAVPQFGAPLLVARAPRAYVDLNRSREDLDAALIEGAARQPLNSRINSGLGVIPRVVAGGRVIRSGKMSLDEAFGRLTEVWDPYHAALQDLMDQAVARFGQAIMIDCHSMPREALKGPLPSSLRRPHIVIGDRYGASASAAVSNMVEEAFQLAGFRVARNRPFAGAYIAHRYGQPDRGRHVVQVEIDRSLYMDERTLQPNADYAGITRRLEGVIARLVAGGQARGQGALAAE